MEQLFYYILTGAMGSGKSTIIRHLLQNNFFCIPEPAREILMEQRNINADGVPEKNPDLFTQLMLSRATNSYKKYYENNYSIIFDRAIPDMIAYADLFQLDTKIYYSAANYYKYNNMVFLFKGWKEIYTNDNERKMNFEQANDFGNRVEEIYHELGYNIITVPNINIDERIKFIENIILENKLKKQ